jgi:glycopeptide antibiotics resistance protein
VNYTLNALLNLGLPIRLVTSSRVEFALNALMIAPLPLLASWAGAQWSWERWTAYAFITAAAVETIQGLVLPNRSGQFHDIAANTLGTLLGALLTRLLILWRGLSN